jgi:RNA polymerase sigma factor (sigma-70 family)
VLRSQRATQLLDVLDRSLHAGSLDVEVFPFVHLPPDGIGFGEVPPGDQETKLREGIYRIGRICRRSVTTEIGQEVSTALQLSGHFHLDFHRRYRYDAVHTAMGLLDWAGIYEHLMRDHEDRLAWFSLQRRAQVWARDHLGSRGREAVEDAVAETCADIAVALEKARGPETFAGFCFGHFLNARRRVLRASRGLEPLDVLGEDIAAPEEDSPDPVEIALLKQCLEWLEGAHPKEHRAVDLRFYDERSPADIARVIDCEPNHARQIVFRGLAHLRKCVGSKFGGQYAAS